jgi:hypothetical protein
MMQRPRMMMIMITLIAPRGTTTTIPPGGSGSPRTATTGLLLCSFSNPVSHRGLLTCDDASRLARCHRALVSNSCHFLRTPPPVPGRPTQSLRDADNPAQNVPSRDAYQVRCTNGRPRSGRLTYHLLSSVSVVAQRDTTVVLAVLPELCVQYVQDLGDCLGSRACRRRC